MEIARETINAIMFILTALAVAGILVISWYRFRFYNRKRQKKLMTEFMVKGLEETKKEALYQEMDITSESYWLTRTKDAIARLS